MKKDRIEKYHFEEIVLILLILASELSKYDEDDLTSFGESIEGRIDMLFTKEFLSSLSNKYGINENTIIEFERLKNHVVRLYESQWIKKFASLNLKNNMIRQTAINLLRVLKIKEYDPKKFSEEHLDIDW